MTGNSVAITAIVTSGIVTLGGTIVPWSIHRSDQKYKEKLRIISEKKPTYLLVSDLVRHFRYLDREQMNKVMAESFGPVSLWASDEVRELLFAYTEILPTTYGPDVSDEQRKLAFASGEKLRKQMATELQIARRKRRTTGLFARRPKESC